MRSVMLSDSGPPEIAEAVARDPLFIRSVARAMRVLAAFHRTDRPLTLAEIAEAGGVDRSAAQRIVYTLRATGHIERDADDRGYVPGIRVLDHTLDYLRLNPLIERATPVLLELRRNVRERVDLSLFDDLRMVYAVRLQSKRESFFATLVGHSVPSFCTSGGRAVMAQLADEEVESIIARSDRRPFTVKTVTEPDAIRDKVREARETGYALTLEELLLGEIAVGVPVIGRQGRPVAAIHIAGSLSEWSPRDFCGRFAPLAAEAARAIRRH